MKCRCFEGRHDFRTALWHRAYYAWYDHDRAGHRVRAAVLGKVADLLVPLLPTPRARRLARR